MQRKPRPPEEPLFTPFFIWRLTFVSLLMMLGAVSLFLWRIDTGGALEVARTMAVNTVVLCEVVYLINSRRLRRSILSVEGIFGNPYALLTMTVALLFQFLYVYWSPMHGIFGSAALSLAEWLLTLGAALTLFLAVEAEKWIAGKLKLAR